MVSISSYSFPQMTDLIKRSFQNNLDSLENGMRKSSIVKEEAFPHGQGLFKRFAEKIDLNQYAGNRSEGNTARQATPQYGYENDLELYGIGEEISITKVMRDTGKDSEILDNITRLTSLCPNRIDLDLSHRLTFCTATTYTDLEGLTRTITVGDGLALVSAVHTLTGSSTTYSNIITGNPQFSKGGLELAEKSFVEESYNNLGEKMSNNPNIIITTEDPNTCNQVKELLKATANIDTSNSGTINSYYEKYKHMKMNRLATTATGAVDTTKRKNWGLANSDKSDFKFCVLNEPYVKTPKDGNNGEDFSTENRNYLTAANYGMTIISGKWLRWSLGDGS